MQKQKLSPKSEAIAYRAYIWARDREWDCTMAECAEALGVSVYTLAPIMRVKGWHGRFRSNGNTESSKLSFMVGAGLRGPGDTAVHNQHTLRAEHLRALGVHVENDG